MDATRRDIAESLRRWTDQGRACVLATVAWSSDSAPRGLGAQLAIASPAEWSGALSGGCTESAVIDEASRLLAHDDDRAASYVAYAKETFGDVGPVCGATLGVVVERVGDDLLRAVEAAAATAGAGADVEVASSWTFVDDAPSAGAALEPGRSWPMVRGAVDVREPVAELRPFVTTVTYEQVAAELRVVQGVPGAPLLLLDGGGDVARELVLLARRLGWRTTIVDPRRSLLEQTVRACAPDRAEQAWAADAWDRLGVDRRTACVALAHESHIDQPFLELALASDAAYVGAVGSRRVQAERREALVSAVGEQAIQRLHGPAGLDLGGSSAAEVALSIAAEVAATFHERSGGRLVAGTGPIRA